MDLKNSCGWVRPIRQRQRAEHRVHPGLPECRPLFSVQIRFRGGVTQSLTLPLPQSAAQLRKTKEGVIAEIDRLLNTNTEREIATILNERWPRQ